MSGFNEAVISEGLRIEVENDLYQNESVMDKEEDEEEVIPSITVTQNTESASAKESPVASLPQAEDYDSGPEDGELSVHGSPQNAGDGDEDMEVDDDEDNAEETPTDSFSFRRGSNSGSHETSGSMPRGSSSGADSNAVNGYRPRTYPNPYLSDVLVSEEKLNSRAARFGLSSGSQGGTVTKPVIQPLPTDQELVDLYTSLGLIEDDGGEITLAKVGKQYRLNSLLIRGTNQMSTNEIFAYLRDNNQRPLEMEWVNDACCVVIYKDNYEAARTLFSMTKPITVEPRPERKTDIEGGEAGEIEDDTEEMSQDFDFQAAETISSRYIVVPMPPGYTWRFAQPCKQARGILMRYATIHDKKQEKSERHSEYYKKFGNPNFPGFGITTTSMKNRLRKQRSVDNAISPSKIVITATVDSPEESAPISNRTAWSQLSQNWNDEESGVKPRNPIRFDSTSEVSPKRFPSSHRGGLTTRSRGGGIINQSVHRAPLPFSPDKNIRSLKVVVDFDEPRPSTSIHSRLTKRRREGPGHHRQHRYDDDEEEEEEESGNRSYRNRDRDRDDDDDRGSNSESDDEDNEESRWSKKLSSLGPRMRMHADEEEEKIMRARQAGASSRYHSKAGKLAYRLNVLRSNRR